MATDNYDPYENVSHLRSNVAAHGQTKGHLITLCQVGMVIGALIGLAGNGVIGGSIFLVATIGIAILTL